MECLRSIAELLNNNNKIYCNEQKEKLSFALTVGEKLRLMVISDVVIAKLYGLTYQDYKSILAACDYPIACLSDKKFTRSLFPKGFWRVDRELSPELRQTVLSLVAFCDLESCIASCGDDRDAGIQAFLAQHDGEGWMLPETLRLADYGLGHDERAQLHQPVAALLGPRFYDWQLAQTAEEFRDECNIHAQNLRRNEISGDIDDSQLEVKESDSQLIFDF